MQTKQRLSGNSYCLKSSSAVFQTLLETLLKCRLTLLISRASVNVGVCEAEMPSWDGFKSSQVIHVIIITRDLQLSFDLCLHLGGEGCDSFSCVSEISPLSRSDTHSDHPAEITMENKFHRVRLLWITACVHVVCEYCSVTLEADPGSVCHVPRVCKEYRHVLFTRFLRSNIQ